METKKPELDLFKDFQERFNGIEEFIDSSTNKVTALFTKRQMRSKNYRGVPHHITDVVLTSYKRELTRNRHQITCVSGTGLLKIIPIDESEEGENAEGFETITLGNKDVLQIILSEKHGYELVSEDGMEVEIIVIEQL
jgi:hypothetical protein